MSRRLLLLLAIFWCPVVAQAGDLVLIVVGPSNHPPGTHEVAAGARLVEHCLENSGNVEDLNVEVSTGWPEEERLLEEAATVVFVGDTFPAERVPNSGAVMQRLGQMMQDGCGIVCIHYATGLRDEDVADNGDHPLLHWTGGYFATRNRHHQSVARVLTATIEPADVEHPVLRGWKPFTLTDEPYYNNYFGPNGPAANVTPLAVSQLPPEDPSEQIVAWSVQRADGGRGMGIVMPHFYRSWTVQDLRTLILNGIVWTAGRDVPNNGVESTVADLTIFEPQAVSPRPRK